MKLLHGKKTLVTGGTSGLGKAIALGFVEQGADVAIYGTNLQRAEEVLSELNGVKVSEDQQIFFNSVDVSKKDKVDCAAEALLQKWGSLDILVNCAGITRDKLLLKMTEEDWDLTLDVNLKSVYNLSQAFVKSMMKARRGKIINISSIVGLIGNPGQANYAASKMGMIGFTKSLARELGPRNITVNCVAPGFFKTKMTDVLPEDHKASLLQRIPLGRLGDPKEIANIVVFLGSSMADYITGQVISVDGGMTA